MPRPKGSKNKLKRRDPFAAALHRVLPRTTIDIVQKLAQKSNIDMRRVLDDAVLEGAAELEIEAYASLIDFNERRGKVVRERENERINQPTLGRDAPEIEGAPGAIDSEDTSGDPASHDDVNERPGYAAPDNANPLLATGDGRESEGSEL